MDPFALLDFQIKRLGYQFQNVDLLMEALTHSLDPQDHVPGFPDQNRTYKRLQVIGNAVLKFTTGHYVVQTSSVDADEGVLAVRKDSLVHGDIQTIVGKRLVEGVRLTKFVRVSRSVKDRPGSSSTVPFNQFKELIRAIMGAVFIDAGGITGDGMASASAVFLKIWGKNLDIKTDKCAESIQASFPPPTPDVEKVWQMRSITSNFIQMVENCLGAAHKFRKRHLLGEAVIHASFYEGVTWSNLEDTKHRPHYQRLEFLGDGVLELVVTEMMWRAHPPDIATKSMSEEIRLHIQETTQKEICKMLGLDKCVKMKPGGIPEWNRYDDIVESVVGALFVDGGGAAVKEFVTKVWGLPEIVLEPDLDELETKLSYKFNNRTFLRRALTLPGSEFSGVTRFSELITDETRLLREVLVYFGKSWIQFHSTDVVLRTCDPDDSLALLVHRRNHLCSEAVLLRIGSYLNLSKYISLSRDELARGKEPYMFYQNVVEALAGAIFKDMQEVPIKMAFGKVFYRLWNPFFKTRPPASCILDNFGLMSERLLPSYELAEIQANIRYQFRNRAVLEQTFNSSRSSASSGKYAIMGESARDLVVSVYVAILIHMNIDKVDVDQLDVEILHSSTLCKCINEAEELFEAEQLREYCDGRVSTDELLKRVLGAVYMDMSDESSDGAFSKWKQYFMITCGFITGKQQAGE